jgi:hypothetical protein
MPWRANVGIAGVAIFCACIAANISASGAAPDALAARDLTAATPALPAPSPVTTPEQRLAEAQAAYDHAADPISKAKTLAKLEPEVFAKARATLDAGDDVGSLAQLQHFRDETNATMAQLEKLGPTAQNHPSGFKELQIALREAVRQMDNIIVELPPDKHPWFRDVRSDLADAQNELIDLLFPHQQRKTPAAKQSPS